MSTEQQVGPSHSKLSSVINNTKVLSDDSTPFEPKASLDKSSAEYIIKTGVAGGLAGSTAKTLIAPLDRIKILFQTSNPVYRKYAGSVSGLFKAGGQIYKNDGLRGFFQGHSATLLRIFPYAAIKFVAYEQVRRVLIPSDEYETSIRRLMSGSISGLCSVFLTYPLDLIRVRLAFETKKFHKSIINVHHQSHFHSFKEGRLMSIITDIYREHPKQSKSFPVVNMIKRTLPPQIANLTNFYRGFVPTIMGMIPYAGVSFWTHDLVHDILRHPSFRDYTVDYEATSASHRNSNQRIPLTTWAQLLAGGVAGMFSQTAAYPFEVVRRRMQVGGVNNGEFISLGSITKTVWKEKGFRGFYVGLSIGYIKIIPMVACSYYVYERCKFHMGI